MTYFPTFPNIPGAFFGTLYLVLACVLIGILLHFVDLLLTGILSRIIGSIPAFLVRNYLTYPGTICHELAHAAAATITGARVTRITLIPHGTTLGSVDFIPRGPKVLQSLQLFLTSIAPVPVGLFVLSAMYLHWLPLCTTTGMLILFWYLFISVFFHMTLSIQDLLNMGRGLPATLGVLFLILLFTRVDVTGSMNTLITSILTPL